MPVAREHLSVLGMHFAPEPTGSAPYTSGMAIGLAGAGKAVEILTTHPHYPEWAVWDGYGQWARTDEIDGVTVRRLRCYIPRAPSLSRRFASEASLGFRWLTSRLGKPAVVVLTSPAMIASAIAMVRIRIRRSTPSIVWVQDVYSTGLDETAGTTPGLGKRLIRALESFLFRSADHVIVCHEIFRTKVEALGVEPSRISVIRNWTHVDSVAVEQSTDARAAVRHSMGWPDNTTVVLHAGNQGVKQGLENVVAASRRAAENDLPIKFVLLGNGNQHEELKRLAGETSTIDFLPAVSNDDFLPTLQAADILLVNEKVGVSEMSVPSKLTSYFAACRPVIAASHAGGATAQELEASRGGVRVDPGQPEELVDAIVDLSQDTSRANSLGQNGAAYRRDVLDFSAALRAFEHVIDSVNRDHLNHDDRRRIA